jgi:large subunit ribosomal protein L35Ae
MNQDSGTNILRIQGVADKKATEFYMGKRVAYVYKVTKKTPTSPGFRVIWGRITRPHGTSGAVRAQFRNNLPPKALGGQVRIMLYPSRV